MKFSKTMLTGVLLVTLLVGGGESLFAQSKRSQQPASRQDLQQMYMDFLGDQGYSPTIDSDGNVQFKKEGRTFWIVVNEDDLEFFTISFIGNYELKEDWERDQFPIAVVYANRFTKVAKVYSLEDGGRFMISGELFIPTPDAFKPVFERLLSAMMNARDNFIKKMQEN